MRKWFQALRTKTDKPAGKGTDRLFLFVHLPKCAGTSLLKMFARASEGRCVTLAETPSKSAAWEIVKSAASGGEETRVIMGRDVIYGMHRLFSKKPYYITFLRDPVQRYVSQYNFYVDLANQPGHPAHHVGVERVVEAGKLVSLPDFARRGSDQNMLTRALADANDPERQRDPWWHVDPGTALARASDLLARMDFVGLVETFEADCSRLFREFEIQPAFERVNTSRHQVELNDELLATIRENNRLDLDLYSRALQLIQARSVSE